MGAKQSKRSVDISGKEAEGGGEVAAAGAGGEGRVEPLADADALKPQLNGDAHIQTEPTEKEKELDSGTPENEKDATTEKEGKEENEKENEAAPVTNGEAEEKIENGESTPVAEDGKKPKKEKVKKKWSLRSISFSRKDKPKQEKKQKDEELKTNGEPEKVPEETAEAGAAGEPVVEEVATEAAAESAPAPAPAPAAPAALAAPAAAPEEPAAGEAPLANGAATPEPAQETPAPTEPEPAPAPAPEPEQLPVNGLTLEEPKPEVPQEKVEEIKPEPPAIETVEIAPAPEIPAKEVCVQQMPLLESTPPPLPANPPPSSVASFAATTMAPELTDASLPNTADTAAEPLSALTNTQSSIDEVQSPPPTSISDATELPSPLKETSEDMPPIPDANEPDVQAETGARLPQASPAPAEPSAVHVVPHDTPLLANDQNEPSKEDDIKEQSADVTNTTEASSKTKIEDASVIENTEPKIEILESDVKEVPEPEVKVIPEPEPEVSIPDVEHIPEPDVELIPEPEVEQIPEPEISTSEIDDTPLPPPPVQDDIEMETSLENGDGVINIIPEPITESEKIEANHVKELTNGVDEISLEENSVTAENAKNKAKAVALAASVGAPAPACNGGRAEPQPALAAPAAHTPQEPVSVSDKLADLIPEVPDVPEINTETLQATDVAVSN